MEGPPDPTGAAEETGSSPQGAQPTVATASTKAVMVSLVKIPRGSPLAPPVSGTATGPIGGHSDSTRGETGATSKKKVGGSASKEEKKKKWAAPDV